MSYMDFEKTYKEPTRMDWLKDKFTSLPTWKSARYNSLSFQDGPMSEKDWHAHFTAICGTDASEEHKIWCKKTTDSLNRHQCLTPTGWYLRGWWKFFTGLFISFEYYRTIHWEQAYDMFLYRKEADEWEQSHDPYDV